MGKRMSMFAAMLLAVVMTVGTVASCKAPGAPVQTEESTTKTDIPSRSEEPTTKPEKPTTKPEEPTTKREEPTKKPEETTVKPEEPTKKPEETTVKPEEPPKPAATVTLSQSALTLTTGEKATLTAIVKNAEDMALEWSSSASDIVSVDNGEVFAKSAGTATITVSLPNGAFATCTIQVDPKPVEIGVYIDGTLVETLTTTVENNYRITIPEKPEDITTDHNADRYFYGWFTDSSLNTPLTEEMTFPNGGKIYGKWIPINFSDYTYTVNYGKATITGAKQTTDTIVVIPSYINSFPVVEIAADVFKDRTMIRTLILCDGIEQIGNGAFYNCNSMINVTIPSSVTSIGSSAFSGCSSLTSITIPDSVTSIGDNVFYRCPIEVATIPAVACDAIGGYYEVRYGKYGTIIERIANRYLRTVSITSGTMIDNSSFVGCTGLTSITISDSVTSIGSSAFNGCSNLIQKEGGVWYVDKWVIGCDPSVTNVTLHNITVGIGDYAFSGCSSLTSISIPDSVTRIGNFAFKGCGSLTSITIPDSVTSIGRYAFENCSSLTSITIPNSVASIGGGAFYICSRLTSITFNGTKAQWNTISKGSDWNYNTGSYTVHCTDGDIKKQS